MTVHIELGVTPSGEAAHVDLEELLATRALIQGNSGSGKSHLLRRLLEQSAASVQQVIIDPEGDFVTLAERFGHLVIDSETFTEGALHRAALRVREHRVSVVLNLEGLDVEQQMRHAAAFLGGLFDAERDFWYPVLVVVDEAQLFAPSAAGEVSDEARKLSLGAMTNLMCRGRKRGLAGAIATQRLAKLAKNVAAEASNFLMGRTFLDIDMARAADLLGMDRRQAEMFRDLQRGHFVALGPALSRRPLALRIGAVATAARSGSPRLMPLPAAPADARDLILRREDRDKPLPAPIRRPPPSADADALFQRARPVPLPYPALEAGEAPAAGAQGQPFDAVIRDVLALPEADQRSIAVLYQDFLVRCRSHGLRGEAVNLAAFRRRLTACRAGADIAAEASPDWDKAAAIAAGLPDDIQGVFLFLARAASAGAPCPADATVARIYGSRSTGRARSVLAYMEQRGLIATIRVAGGWRVITLPALGWETAPGDPAGPEHMKPVETVAPANADT
jgi:hypothetical protein